MVMQMCSMSYVEVLICPPLPLFTAAFHEHPDQSRMLQMKVGHHSGLWINIERGLCNYRVFFRRASTKAACQVKRGHSVSDIYRKSKL